MTDAEMQEEELEVLKSIYEGDPMYSFYNNHLTTQVKEDIIHAVKGEAEQMLGMSMTYTLFEWVKENQDQLMENQPDTVAVITEAINKTDIKEASEEGGKKTKAPKKEQLTKSQKRNAWRKGGLNEEERERGWNWVDVVKHLHQTGNRPEEAT